MNQIRTHRGFIVGPGTIKGYLDLPLVDELYKRMETTHDFAADFGYLNDTLKAAKQVLFNNAKQFIILQQLKNDAPYWVKHFSLSTLRYLNGEPRALALENYRDLMLFHPKDVTSMEHGELIRTHQLEYAYASTPGQIIGRWLAQEDGLTDLVMSLQLIAGALPEGWHDRSQAA